MEETIRELLDFLSMEFAVMLTAALPMVELKGAIPVEASTERVKTYLL